MCKAGGDRWNIYHLKEANEDEERAALSRFIPL